MAATNTGRGVSLMDLNPLTFLTVQTLNSTYHLVVLDGTAVRIRGPRFPDYRLADVNGSRTGAGPLQHAWIGLGLRMEIVAAGRRIVTSPVVAITSTGAPAPEPEAPQYPGGAAGARV
jgi:hypothetical protein